MAIYRAYAGAASANKTIRVCNSGDQTVTSGSAGTVTLNSTLHNDDSTLYSLASSKITVSQAGAYLVSCTCIFQGGSTGERLVDIRIDDASINLGAGLYTNGTNVRPSVNAVVRLTAGQTVSLGYFADGGTDMTIASPYAQLSLARLND